MHRTRDLILLLGTLFVLSFFIVFGLGSRTTFSPQRSSATTVQYSNWEKPKIGFADLIGSESISEEEILANTDFRRKIVSFDPSLTELEKEKLALAVGGEVVEDLGGGLTVISLPEENLGQAESDLAQNEGVEGIETDYAVSILGQVDWGVTKIKAPEVWPKTQGAGVRIAIVDTGIDRVNPDMGRYAGGYDFVNEDADPQDDHGHGTAVAGIALAAQNGNGVIGVSPQSSLLGVKVLSASGVGYISDVVEGLNWAVANGASVINLSLGTTFDSSTLRQAVDAANSQGILVVAAAGNTNGGSLNYPAAYDSVVAVGAVDTNNNLASFSAIGSELVAPGVGITSSWLGGGTRVISGTSAASPHVAGLAALLIGQGARDPRASLRMAQDLGVSGVDPYYGFGLVDAVLASDVQEDDEAPEVTFLSPQDGEIISTKVGTYLVEISAKDNKSLSKVDLIVNDRFAYSSTTLPFQWLWDLSQVKAGNYVLTAHAVDGAENESETSVRVIIAQQGAPVPTAIPGNLEEVLEKIPNSLPAPAIEKVPTFVDLPSNQGRGRGRVRGIAVERPLSHAQVLYFFFRSLFN